MPPVQGRNIRIFYYSENGKKPDVHNVAIGDDQSFMALSQYPNLCQGMGLTRLPGQFYYGSVTFGTVFLWRHDQQLWVEMNTACHFMVQQNTYLLIKKNMDIDELPGFGAIAPLLCPHPPPFSSTSPMPLDQFQYLLLQNYWSSLIPTPTLTLLQRLQDDDILPAAMGPQFYNRRQLNRRVEQFASFNEIISDTTPPIATSYAVQSWEMSLAPDILVLPTIPLHRIPTQRRKIEVQLFFKLPFAGQYRRPHATIFADGVYCGHAYLPESQLMKIHPAPERRQWPDNFSVLEVLRGIALMDKVDRNTIEGRFSYIFRQPAPDQLQQRLDEIANIQAQASDRYGGDGLHYYVRSRRTWKVLASGVRRRRNIRRRMRR